MLLDMQESISEPKRPPKPEAFVHLFLDADIMHLSLVNSRKQLENFEHEYVTVLKKFKKLTKKPNTEN